MCGELNHIWGKLIRESSGGGRGGGAVEGWVSRSRVEPERGRDFKGMAQCFSCVS